MGSARKACNPPTHHVLSFVWLCGRSGAGSSRGYRLFVFRVLKIRWRLSVGRLLDPYSRRPFTLQASLRVKLNTHALVLSAKLRTIHNLRSTVSL